MRLRIYATFSLMVQSYGFYPSVYIYIGNKCPYYRFFMKKSDFNVFFGGNTSLSRRGRNFGKMRYVANIFDTWTSVCHSKFGDFDAKS